MALIILYPFLGALFWAGITLAYRKPPLRLRVVRFGVTVPVLLSSVTALYYWSAMLQMPPEERQIREVYFTWIAVHRMDVQIGLFLDPLSILLVLLITGVGSLIHIYSIAYMDHDRGFIRYFAWLNLFTALMLLLVMADNVLLMFIGWEGVGLCSYWLIGFWFSNIDNARAGLKAFLVNRIGDTAFIVALFLLFWKGSDPDVAFSFSFQFIAEAVTRLSQNSLYGIPLNELVALLFVLGATGKSAQVPLFVWLPDAMAGPTPVSALIHAATMVTAGVYMIGRMSVLYLQAPIAMAFIVTVGVATALFAAIVAVNQNDIKKVLAYSTISQLGFMFAALGVGAFTGAVFHLLTHGFFKALLFLSAGSVILGTHHEQDMRKMGGMVKSMPVTAVLYLTGVLSIAGFFPFSGFFSKDEILLHLTLAAKSDPFMAVLLAMATLAAFLTSFYMFRSFFMVFSGEQRTEAHESGRLILIPLGVLAGLSLVGGFMNVPHALGGHAMLHDWLQPVFKQPGEQIPPVLEWSVMAVGTALSAFGFLLAYLLIARFPLMGSAILKKTPFIYKISLNRFYVDELYEMTVQRPILGLARAIDRFDRSVIDSFVNRMSATVVIVAQRIARFDVANVDGAVALIVRGARRTGSALRRLQDGYIYHYLAYSLLGVLMMVIVWQAMLGIGPYTFFKRM
ncbi:MAG: NADH-quinone oxidoreductase subunit L [Leptonema illini]|uniref:NADH-quinone oxidoreductase subunit L n=1 Tax=Leptonema illini TaxID=183 RepID=A0A833LYQ4_9LEPT|nr:MAG: NADH-quinone oxidoreductase subunit L [Leptonema illini]